MHKWLKWFGIIMGSILVLMLVALGGLYWRSQALLNRVYTAPPIAITVPTDAASIARGEHLAKYVSVCVDCHGANLEGSIVVDDPVLGRIVAPNLTTGAGGLGGKLSDAQMATVLRYGILTDGRSAKIMPSDDYQHLSNEDLGALIAYVRSVPPQDSDLPANEIRLFGRILFALGRLPILIAERIDPANEPPTALTPTVSLEYGHYLSNIAGCTGCHGPGLSGGPIPAAPPDWPQAANLTPGGPVGQWSEADFINTIRTGIDPAGKKLVQEMPWFRYRDMRDDELKAIWLFVQSVPAQAMGNR
ncbi:MAG: cytochrome c [Caldilineaceae bacterium]